MTLPKVVFFFWALSLKFFPLLSNISFPPVPCSNRTSLSFHSASKNALSLLCYARLLPETSSSLALPCEEGQPVRSFLYFFFFSSQQA